MQACVNLINLVKHEHVVAYISSKVGSSADFSRTVAYYNNDNLNHENIKYYVLLYYLVF